MSKEQLYFAVNLLIEGAVKQMEDNKTELSIKDILEIVEQVASDWKID